jgi:hemerythrin-like metal-binding protein
MAYFEWADDMVIDEGPIDEDHKKLVDLVNELHTATSEGRGQDVIEKVMTELISYTKEHLRREDQIMASHNFPNLERHKVGHAHFTEKLNALQRQFEGGSITVASQLSAVLRDWLSLHIRRSDKEIKAIFQKDTRRHGGKPA